MNTSKIFLAAQAEHGDLHIAIFGEEFSPKMVGWEAIVRVANALTNQLGDAVGVDMTQAHISVGWGAMGVSRNFVREAGHGGAWRPYGQASSREGWVALDEVDVRLIEWWSLKSDCGLEARKVEGGRWLLSFTPGKDPGYRGRYFRLWKEA